MKPFTVVDVPQRSPEWFTARLGRLTGSCAGDMLAKIKSGESASRRNLRLRLVLERLTGRSVEPDFISPAMQAGIDREAGAFAAFEALTGEVVHRSGFLAHVSHLAGASLDGHIGDYDALLSIKCRQPAAHYEFLKSGTVPADALAQIRHELWLTGANHHHYFSWNPDFPDHLQSKVVLVPRSVIGDYEREAMTFLREVDLELAAAKGLSVLETA